MSWLLMSNEYEGEIRAKFADTNKLPRHFNRFTRRIMRLYVARYKTKHSHRLRRRFALNAACKYSGYDGGYNNSEFAFELSIPVAKLEMKFLGAMFSKITTIFYFGTQIKSLWASF